MKVKKLKKLLEGLDDNTEIILSIDPEGNAYHPLYSLEEGYIDKKEWGERIENYYSEVWSWQDNGFENQEEWEKFKKKKAKKIIVLFP